MDMPIYPGDPLTGVVVKGARRSIAAAKTHEIPVLPILWRRYRFSGSCEDRLFRRHGAAFQCTYHRFRFDPRSSRSSPIGVFTLVVSWSNRWLRFPTSGLFEAITTMLGKWRSIQPAPDYARGGAHSEFSGGWRPKRTMIFAAWDGEERVSRFDRGAGAPRAQPGCCLYQLRQQREGMLGVSGSHSLERFVAMWRALFQIRRDPGWFRTQCARARCLNGRRSTRCKGAGDALAPLGQAQIHCLYRSPGNRITQSRFGGEGERSHVRSDRSPEKSPITTYE
jgi:hypothetical protein